MPPEPHTLHSMPPEPYTPPCVPHADGERGVCGWARRVWGVGLSAGCDADDHMGSEVIIWGAGFSAGCEVCVAWGREGRRQGCLLLPDYAMARAMMLITACMLILACCHCLPDLPATASPPSCYCLPDLPATASVTCLLANTWPGDEHVKVMLTMNETPLLNMAHTTVSRLG